MAVALVLLGACAPQSRPSRPVAQSEIVARSLMSAWESRDHELLADLFLPSAVYDDFANQMQYHGIEEITGYVDFLHGWATSVTMNVTAVHASETGAVAEWVFSAIQDRPIGDRVPVATGREVVLNGVTILEIEGGRIRRAADYIDSMPLILQLGGEVHMPGGSVIKLDNGVPRG